MKHLFKVRYFFLYLLFFLLFFVSGFYAYYLYNYEPPEISHLLEHYPEDFLLKVGDELQLPGRRFQHFLNFPPLKEKDTVRVGTFGDSHTFGDEVDKTACYPYLLQQLFDKKFPNAKIEILNFGMSGTGFQEQFFLWEKYSKIYNLDYILLGPRGFYSRRDVTFRISWDFQYFKYPKERFVLSENNTLRQVHIKGESLKERYKNYYKLIPTWTALRYDKKPFKIWEYFFPLLRHNIQNPFYYTKMSDREESVKINTLLLKKIRDVHDRKILFVTDQSSIFNSYQRPENLYNLNHIQLKERCFYRVFSHASSLENENMANIYFNALIGRAEFPLKIINCYFKEIGFVSNKLKKGLYQIRSIKVIDKKGTSLATFRRNVSDHHHNEGSYFKRKEKWMKSFIGFSNGVDFLDFPFFPLPIQLKTGMKISIQLPNKKRIDLGRIRALDQFEKFFVLYENFIVKKRYQTIHYESWFLLKQMPVSFENQIKEVTGTFGLFVEDYKLGTLYFDDFYGKRALRFIPVNGYKKSFLMMGPSHSVRESDFPAEFPVYIQYNVNDSESFKSLIPDWKCKKKKQHIHLKLPHFDPLNLQ